MNTIAKWALVAAVTVTGFSACNNSGANGDKSASDSTKATPRKPVALAKVGNSPEFANATLAMASATAEKAGSDSTKVTFNFDVNFIFIQKG